MQSTAQSVWQNTKDPIGRKENDMSYLAPGKQQIEFLKWFNFIGVELFDIYVKRPVTDNEDYKQGDFLWITKHESVTTDYIKKKLLSWIKYENTHGSDVYFRPHKNSVHPVIFLDDVSVDKSIKIAAKYTACVVETSINNTQVWLATDSALNKQERKGAQIYIKEKGFSDPGSIAGDHLGRICGVKSQKHGCWINLLKVTDVKLYTAIIDAKEFSTGFGMKNDLVKKTNALKRDNSPSSSFFCALKKDTSASGREFGWVLGMLRSKMNHDDVMKKLIVVAQNRGKPNAEKYAETTMKKALDVLLKYG